MEGVFTSAVGIWYSCLHQLRSNQSLSAAGTSLPFMQAAARHLSAAIDGKTPVCFIAEDVDAFAGAAAAWQVLARAAEVSSSCAVLVLLFLDPPAHADRQVSAHIPVGAQDAVYVRQLRGQQGDEPHVIDQVHKHIQQCAQCSDGAHSCPFLLIDSLDAAIVRFGAHEVVSALRELADRKQVRGIVAHAHGPAQAPQTLAFLRSIATCALILRPVKELQLNVIQKASGHKVHFEAITSTLRNSGRVRIDSELLEFRPEGHLVQRKDLSNVPITAQQLAAQQVAEAKQESEKKAAADHTKLQSKYQSDMSGFMKLSLSDKEKQARQSLVLPWQHSEQQLAAKDTDFKSYLPPAAGGQGRGAGKQVLGHILYVRDSDNDCDSDEDPDDDLDI